MATIRFIHKGDFSKTERSLKKMTGFSWVDALLNKYGQLGVNALKEATPVDTGKTAESWGYQVLKEPGKYIIEFTNSNVVNYVNIAIILEYGHRTATGGWVEGRDYIKPALQPVFEKLANDAWTEVISK